MKPVRIPSPSLPGALFIWRCPSLAGGTLSPSDAACLSEAGITHVFCLLGAAEVESLSARRAAVEALGMRFHSAPIADFAAPTLSQAELLVAEATRLLGDGAHILVHCMAGLGRSGTVAALLCVSQGMGAGGAIALVRRVRPGAIESAEQEALVRAFAL